MQKKAKLIRAVLVFVACSLLMLFVFYFYPAEIFEVKVVNYYREYTTELALRPILIHRDLPEEINRDTLVSISLTAQGAFILFICILGLPAMIAWRTMLNKYRPQKEEPENLEES